VKSFHDIYGTENEAFENGFGGSRYAKKGKRARATRGSCCNCSGNHEHINIYERLYNDYIGAIVSCEYCTNTTGGAVITKIYKAIIKGGYY
jgi:hypothetical protein